MPSKSLFLTIILDKFRVKIPRFLPLFASKDLILNNYIMNQGIYQKKKLSV